MNEQLPKPTSPWQPLTFGGVAAFAHGTPLRILMVALVFALIVAGSVVWFLAMAWCPALEQAIGQLPEQGQIRRGQLEWLGAPQTVLSEGSFLSIAVDMEDGEGTGPMADLQLKFCKEELKIRSWFGYWPVPYRPGWIVAFNRPELQPAWGAWKPHLLAGAGALVAVAVLASWIFFATVLATPVRLFAFYADREVSWPGCWRFCLAALLPGALFMAAAIVLYRLQQLNLAGLLAAAPAHLLLGWFYLVFAGMRLPRVGAAARSGNPFAASSTSASTDAPPKENV